LSLDPNHWRVIQACFRGTLVVVSGLLAFIVTVDAVAPAANDRLADLAESLDDGLTAAVAIGTGVAAMSKKRIGVLFYAAVGIFSIFTLNLRLLDETGVLVLRDFACVSLLFSSILLGLSSCWLSGQNPSSFHCSTRHGIRRVAMSGLGLCSVVGFTVSAVALMVSPGQELILGTIDIALLSLFGLVIGMASIVAIGIPSLVIVHGEFTDVPRGLWSADLLNTLVAAFLMSSVFGIRIGATSTLFWLLILLGLAIAVAASALWEKAIADGYFVRGPGFFILAFAGACLLAGATCVGGFLSDPNSNDAIGGLVFAAFGATLVFRWLQLVSVPPEQFIQSSG
jgi:hypothetical protein